MLDEKIVFTIFTLSLIVLSLFGCKKKKQIQIEETTVAYETQERDNLKEIQNRIDNAMRYEYVAVLYNENGKSVQKNLSYKDNAYESLPNIPFNFVGTHKENDKEYYLYKNESTNWLEDVFPSEDQTEETIEEEIIIMDEDETENNNELTGEKEINNENELKEEVTVKEENNNQSQIEETTKESIIQETTKEIVKETETIKEIEVTEKRKIRIVNVLEEIEQIENSSN